MGSLVVHPGRLRVSSHAWDSSAGSVCLAASSAMALDAYFASVLPAHRDRVATVGQHIATLNHGFTWLDTDVREADFCVLGGVGAKGVHGVSLSAGAGSAADKENLNHPWVGAR